MTDEDASRNQEAKSAEALAVVDRDSLVRDHMWLVKCISRAIHEHLPQWIDLDDLISVGTMGLIKAVDDFDPARGARLETYARYRIRGAVLDELRRLDIFPSSTRMKLHQLEDAIMDLERSLGRYPADEEIAEKSGLSLQEISGLLSDASMVVLYSLDELTSGSDDLLGSEVGEAVATSDDPLATLERQELEGVLVGAIEELPATERSVLGLYYYDGLRMKEIGKVLNISESRV
ncbi:MAG TPA: FliA/WhiG family RNA polymerase sigma factor, partial [bacterium]|nr:FliA/WhiG family RNA polymerase sigma factor [bacterium]